MYDITDAPQEISETDLETVRGGAETVHLYLQSNGEKVDRESTLGAGLRSDGDLVQSVADGPPKEMVLDGQKILQN